MDMSLINVLAVVIIVGIVVLRLWIRNRRSPNIPPSDRGPIPNSPQRITGPDLPHSYELVPNELSVLVYESSFNAVSGDLPCWTYVSSGLRKLGQQELVLSVRQPDSAGSVYPLDPLHYFADVYHLARDKRFVGPGSDMTEYSGDRIYNFRGFAYIRSESIEGVDLPESALAVIALRSPEFAVARQHGITRVFARLGRDARYYPTPPWVDPLRADVAYPNEREKTILEQISRVRVDEMHVSLRNNQIALRALPSAQAHLGILEELPADKPIAFMTQMDVTAQGCFVWEPGQDQPQVIHTGDCAESVTGNFVAFLAGQAENQGRIHEDGFMVMLTDDTWDRVRRALLSGDNVSVPVGENQIGFEFEWIPTEFVNPMDGTVMYASGGWRTYGGKTQRHSGEQVTMQCVTLLTDDYVAARRVDVEELGNYVTQVKDEIEDSISGIEIDQEHSLVLEFDIDPVGHVVLRDMSSPDLGPSILERIREIVLALRPPRVRNDSVSFQIEFVIWSNAEDCVTALQSQMN